MAEKNMKISFLIGAALQSNFTGAFRSAAQAIFKSEQASKAYNSEVKSLAKAFDSGTISAESFKRALSIRSLGELATNFAKLKGHMYVFGQSVSALKTISAPFVNAASVAANFEQAMSKVGAITKAGADDMEKLSAKAKELGAATQFSATQSAEAMSYLGMAGWNTNQILAGMPGLLSLAAAGGTDLARTADIVSDNLTAFGLSAEKSAHMADVYAAVITSTNTNVEMLGDTMKYAAPVAHAFGASMEETAALAGLMANSGIKASQAGTALRSGFLRLAGPPKMAAKAMESLGMSLNDITAEQKEAAMAMASLGIATSDVNGPRKMSAILTDLRNKTKSLGNEEKLAAMKAIFGTEAATGWLAVLDSGDGTFDKLVTQLEESDGAANKMAERMQNNAAGAMTRYKSAVEAINISIGSAFLPAMASGADALAGFVGGLANNQTAVNFALAIGGGTAAAVSFVAIVSAGKAVVDSYRVAVAAYNTVSAIFKTSTVGMTAMTIAHNVATTAGAVAQWAWNGALSAGRLGIRIMRLTAMAAATLANTAATTAVTAAQWAWNAAMNANPIGLLVLAIGGLIAAGVTLYNNWDTVKTFFVNLWDNPTAKFFMFVTGPIGWIIAAGTGLIANWETVRQWFITLWDNPTLALQQFINGIKSSFTEGFDWIKDKWKAIQDFISKPIFGRVNITAEGNSSGSIAHNAAGGIYPRGQFLTYFAEESGESAIPHTPTPRNIALLAQTNEIMGNPLNVGFPAAQPEQNTSNVFNSVAHNETYNQYAATPAPQLPAAPAAQPEQNTSNVFNSVAQPAATNITNLLSESKPLTNHETVINATFSPVINISSTGDTSEDKIRNILDEQRRKFKAMLDEMQNRNRRLSYA